MRLPCATQLHGSQLTCRRVYRSISHAGWRGSLLVPHAKSSNQKNEGVYFEYEAVDPDAADEIAALQEEDEEQFSWAQRSRDKKKAYQNKVRGLMSNGGRRQRKGGKRGKPPTDAEARDRVQAAAEAAAAVASNGPVLPSFSPVQTPAMRGRASTPEELLIRPNADPRVAPSPLRPAAGADTQISASERPAASTSPATSDTGPKSEGSGSSKIDDSSATQGGTAAAMPGTQASTGSDRRQRLLQRMKGAAAVAPASGSETVNAAGADGRVHDAVMSAADPGTSAASAPQTTAVPHTDGSGSAAAVAAAGAAAVVVSGAASPAVGADLRSHLAALAAELPSESELPSEAQPARSLLAAILSPTGEDVRQVTTGDVTEMLKRDMSAQEEFAQWLRRASSADGGGEPGAEALTEAEAADLMAALANLDLEGDLADLDLDLGEDDGDEQADDSDGGAAVGAAVRQVSELRQLMAKLDADDDVGQKDESAGEDMTDEQVLAALKASDPALYELLKDVPDFDKLNLDLDLDLDLESEAEKLTEDELAELAAEAAGAGGGIGGQDDEEELETLLADMRGLGLMHGEGDEDDATGSEDGGDLDDEEDGDLALGDLLEAIDEDEELDARARMRAQFALQSMFNQPADELTAKGTRGSGEDASAPPAPPTPRGTTGMARGAAVAADDDDGGAAPPPVLPKPTPKPRKPC